MKKTITLLLLLIVTISGYSQFSKTHYIPPLTSANSTKAGSGAASSTDPDLQQFIYISTPSKTPVTVTITPLGSNTPCPGNCTETKTITDTTPWVYTVDTYPSLLNGSTPDSKGVLKPAKDGFDNQLFVDYSLTSKVLKNKGYLIEASDLVYANVRIQAGSSQSGGLVAKGLSAYGKEFRTGGFENKAPLDNSNYGSQLNFASFVATEDNTTVTVTIPRAVIGVTTFHNGTKYTGPFTVILNKNETYTYAIPNTSSTSFDSNVMLGGLIKSDRNIIVNSGSIGGNSQTSPTIPNGISLNTAGKDYGFDQIVGADKVGKEYIFIGAAGMMQKAYDLERVIIIANAPNTKVFKNGSTTAVATLQPGDYYAFNGNDFVGSATTGYNLYVTTSENVFAYQCIAGKNDAGNQNMFFVPPLNCATPSVVNNIPLIEQVGPTIYPNTVVNITTQATALEATPTITITNPVTKAVQVIPLSGTNCLRAPVTGKPGFFTYTYPKPGGTNPLGIIAVSAPHQVYVSYYGSNSNATYGSYFSGFDTKPSINPQSILTGTNCIGNTTLSVTSAVPTDQFQWLYNSIPDPLTATLIAGAIGNTYIPQPKPTGMGPGFYFVTKISACSNTTSLPIPISECPIDTDTDGSNNNIDMDSDNDGITNTNESYGDKGIDLSNPSGGTIAVGSYSNTFTTATTSTGTGNTTVGTPTGVFTTTMAPSLDADNLNTQNYTLNFAKPTSIGLKYDSSSATVASLSNAAFQISSDVKNTVTILNPSNQLLIDTNNDGIYESNVTQFTSFNIHFKINTSVMLPATGPKPAPNFTIQSYLANSISFTQQNLSTSLPNNITGFSFIALSVPKNSDTDAMDDQVDDDSDNDGIKDIEEGQSGNKTVTPFTDTNKNGLADNFELPTIILPVDTDSDGIPDYIDLDSDNDGILDSVEGVVDSSTPANAIKNYRELDSDGDTCKDTVEAGFTDSDNDGKLGTSPVTVDAQGKVTGGTYVTPNNNYTINKAPTITTQPAATSDCATKAATVTIVATNVGTYEWWVSDNGTGGATGNWTKITNGPTTSGGPIYSGATTGTLSIANAVNGYFYRVNLSSAESACVPLQSAEAEVKMTGVPVANDVTMEQCDTDLDGKTVFDLTSKNAQISTGTGETFSYYTTQALAIAGVPATAIPNATTYTNATAHAMDVWARVENTAGCYDLAKIALTVGVQLPSTFAATDPDPICADPAQPGFATFVKALSDEKTAFEALFPNTGYTITLYKNNADATANDLSKAITSLANYKNTTANKEDIWVRVNNNNTTNFSGCYSITKFTLKVEALPIANPVTIPNQCDDNHDGKFTFNTATLEATLLGGQTGVTVTYFDAANNPLKDANGIAITSPFPATFTTASQIITAVVTNNTPEKCSAKTNIQFVVETLPTANPVTIANQCDDNHDGKLTFNTATLEANLLKGQTGVTATYFDAANNPLKDANGVLITSPFPPTFTTTSQTIKAVVTNNAGLKCFDSTTIQFTIEAIPTANPVTFANQCDDNHDGKLSFNTANLETTLLGGQLTSNVTATYFDAANNPLKDANGVLITSPFPANFTTTSQTIKAVVSNNTGLKCSESTNITFTIEAIPTANTVIIPTQCDDNLDGKLTFNTANLESNLLKGQTGVTVTYLDNAGNTLKDANGVLINSPFPSTFTTTSQTIKAVVTNNAGLKCSESTNITFTIEALPTANAVTIPVQCDDNHDGKLAFNTANLESTLLGGQTGVTATYFDAANNPLKDANGNLITSPFPATFITTSQTIKAVVANNTASKCSVSTNITFTIEVKPFANTVKDYIQCDDDNNPNGEVGFNTDGSTNNLLQQLLGTQSTNNVTVSYFAENGTLITSSTPNKLPNPFITATQTIKAVVTNKAGLGCNEQTFIKFIVDDLPEIAGAPGPFIDCDNEADPMKQDGKVNFNTSSVQSTILGNQQGMTIEYTAQNGVKFVDSLPNPYLSGTQTISFVVKNKNNSSCSSPSGSIQFTVNPLPKINLNTKGNEDQVVCTNPDAPGDLITVDLNAGLQEGNPSDYNYVWKLDGNTLAETSENLSDVSTPGVYTVNVINKTTNCDATRKITVRASEKARFNESNPFTVTDLTEDNTITVNLAPGLKGNYEFSMDDEIGYYQDSNVFTNVSPGTHSVYIRDKNGCGIKPDAVAVIGVPKFFTPNNDGYNDYWTIYGVDNMKYTIFIYDRYGKLLKELIPQGKGWDGIFNGNLLPGSDYWYSLKLENGREAKGHFSLKR